MDFSEVTKNIAANGATHSPNSNVTEIDVRCRRNCSLNGNVDKFARTSIVETEQTDAFDNTERCDASRFKF